MKKLMLAAVLLVGAGVATSRADVSVRISAGHHSDQGSRHRGVLPVPHNVIQRSHAVVVAPPRHQASHHYEAERRREAYHHETQPRREAYRHEMKHRRDSYHYGGEYRSSREHSRR